MHQISLLWRAKVRENFGLATQNGQHRDGRRHVKKKVFLHVKATNELISSMGKKFALKTQ